MCFIILFLTALAILIVYCLVDESMPVATFPYYKRIDRNDDPFIYWVGIISAIAIWFGVIISWVCLAFFR